MNKLVGHIKAIKHDDHMSIVEMEISGYTFKTIIIETPSTASFLYNRAPVNIMFKETEVSIAKDFNGRISLQNKIACVVKKIIKGTLLSKILLNFDGNEIISIITTAAAEQLELIEGDNVTALIKTNEIIIAPI